MTNLALLQRFVDTLYSGDLDSAFTRLHPDVVLHEADGLPFAGTYRGRDGFRQLLERVYALAKIEIRHTEFFDAGDTVIVRMENTFTFHSTGKSVDMAIVELYRFDGDLISYVDVFYKDTHAVVQAAGA